MAFRARRRDANEPEIIAALEAVGVSVQALNAKGVPDLLLGVAGGNILLEVKDGDKPPSARKLTPDQVAWHEGWRGQVQVANSTDEALSLVQDIREAIAERAAKRWADDDMACDQHATEETQLTHGANKVKKKVDSP